jgi:aspartyl-tRNA(Asn)/glutamyl-tRNA(Gln) amidotransferase subunit C
MAPEFTRADVQAIAALANLELEEREIELFARQLADILDYVNHIQQVDTAGVPPTASVISGRERDRADLVQPSLDRGRALANAPEAAVDAGLFKVPRVIG